jgi:hypothetical protein
MRLCFRLLMIAAVFALGAAAYAQAPNLEPNTPYDQREPTVTYQFVYPAQNSPDYAITVESSGNAAFRSRKISGEPAVNGEAYVVKFTLSRPTCERIFALARQANYFEQKPASGVATLNPIFARGSTWFNTLSYSYGQYSWDHAAKSVRNSITYTHASDPTIRQLTAIFVSIAHSLQAGRFEEVAHIAAPPRSVKPAITPQRDPSH